MIGPDDDEDHGVNDAGKVRRAARTPTPLALRARPMARATAGRITVSRASPGQYRPARLTDQRMPAARREPGRWRAPCRRHRPAMTQLYQAGITPPPARRAAAFMRDDRHGVESKGGRAFACPLRELPRATVQGLGERYRRGDRDQMPPLRHHQFFEACEPFTDRQLSGAKEPTLWTYLPNIFPRSLTSEEFRSAPAMPASISACTSPSPDIGLFVSSSGRVMRRPLSWHGWRTRPWARRLSGMTLERSTADRGATAFISSLPAIPANPSAMPATGEARRIRGTSGRTSPALLARPSLNGCSAKTSRGTCPWASPTSSATFDAWATRLRRDCSRREKRALATAGAGSSSWPTPTASDAGYFPDLIVEDGSLRTVSPIDIPANSGGQYALGESARTWTSLWLLMKALGWTARMAASRSSHPVRASFKHGKTSFVGGLISNPHFYEMVMGWPIGWTAPEAPATAFAAWLQHSRGLFSRLLSDFPMAQAGRA